MLKIVRTKSLLWRHKGVYLGERSQRGRHDVGDDINVGLQ